MKIYKIIRFIVVIILFIGGILLIDNWRIFLGVLILLYANNLGQYKEEKQRYFKLKSKLS